jgi:hypothetical protein
MDTYYVGVLMMLVISFIPLQTAIQQERIATVHEVFHDRRLLPFLHLPNLPRHTPRTQRAVLVGSVYDMR